MAQKEIIQKVQTDKFWAEADIFDLEIVREALRDLIKFIEAVDKKIYYTNFSDELLAVNEAPGIYTTGNLQSYRKKVNSYLREHQNHLVIPKLRTNKQLSKQDFLELEKILWNEIGSRDEYKKEFGDTALTML